MRAHQLTETNILKKSWNYFQISTILVISIKHKNMLFNFKRYSTTQLHVTTKAFKFFAFAFAFTLNYPNWKLSVFFIQNCLRFVAKKQKQKQREKNKVGGMMWACPNPLSRQKIIKRPSIKKALFANIHSCLFLTGLAEKFW